MIIFEYWLINDAPFYKTITLYSFNNNNRNNQIYLLSNIHLYFIDSLIHKLVLYLNDIQYD